jgi:hypothetical protein
MIGIALAIGLSGCDYFRPAAPEPPTSGDVLLTNYTHPDSTLETMRRGIEAKSGGAAAYSGALADSLDSTTPDFHHVFWQAELDAWVQSGGQAPSDWNSNLETTFFHRFITLRNEPYMLRWDVDETRPDDIGTDQATIHRRYTLRSFNVTAPGETTFTFLALGFADLTLYRRAQDGAWLVRLWQDRPDPAADPQDEEQMTLGRRRLQSTS